MFTSTFTEAPKFRYKTQDPVFSMLLPRDVTEAMEGVLVTLRRTDTVPTHSHPQEEQMYVVVKGSGRLWIGDDMQVIEPHMVVYVPRGVPHRLQVITDELVYVYVSVWPKGVPPDDKDWKNAMGVSSVPLAV